MSTQNENYCYCFCLISKLLVPRDYFLSKINTFKTFNEQRSIKSVLHITFNNYMISTFYSLNKDSLMLLMNSLRKDPDHKVLLLPNSVDITYLPSLNDLEPFKYYLLSNEDIVNKTIELAIYTLERLESKGVDTSDFAKDEHFISFTNKINFIEQKTEELYKKMFLGNGSSVTSSVSRLDAQSAELRKDVDNLYVEIQQKLTLFREETDKLEKKLGDKLDESDFDLIYLARKTDLKTLVLSFLLLITVSTVGVSYLSPTVERQLINLYHIMIDADDRKTN